MAKRKGNILIIADEPDKIEILTRVLTEAGYIVESVAGGEVALQLVRESRPDLILLDMKLSDMDGCEVCQRLNASHKTSGIPVIFLVSMERPEEKDKAFAAGGTDCLAIPLHAQEILARVAAHLAIKTLRRRLEYGNNRLERKTAAY